MPRYTIDFSAEVDRRVGALRQKLDVKSKAEVVKKALGLLAYVVNEREAGSRIIVERDGNRQEIVWL